ncbi:ABC transporter ATP-binding protein [Cryobacterium breve]|uniref:ABC transporter ATP-binding protein n=1 Tax=Cryobacterium breve TaxID=1259258 RepID=A0ABY7N9P4_9MICO|nr:ABC transporter ATP-binding protein [Cryobacterium breve]WBM79181.1 ABC transporter ATP-binding protein [Cryobacterium breve]
MGVVIERVSFHAGGRTILDDVSAVIPTGSVTGLLGPNGAGKSTLLRLVAGLHTPTSGRITLDDAPLASLGRRETARRIALLEQNASPTIDLLVREVVLLGRIPYRTGIFGGFDGAGDLRIVAESLAQVGGTELADRSWGTLSGGEQQRVQIARALAQRPSLLLLDEPTNHLDIGGQLGLLAQVRDLGLTAVLALHDLNLAAAYCDQILLLADGRLAAAGTPAEVLVPSVIAAVYAVDSFVVPHPRGGHPSLLFAPSPPTSAPSPREST